jgi:hypothetical protein
MEDLDRTGIVSATVPDTLYPWAFEDCLYSEHWLHLYYRVNQKWNLAFVGMIDFAKWMDDDQDPDKKTDDVRTAWGFIPTIEYYPFDNLNLRFYANWVGRVYRYSDYAKEKTGVLDYSTGRFTIGFVSPLGVF